MKKIAALTVLLFMSSALWLSASAFDRLAVGTAANGMGGAFTAVCNDATASYWNSAGLAFIKNDQMLLTYSDLLGLGSLDHFFLGYVRTYVGPGEAGFSWDHLSTKNELSPANFSEETFSVSYGLKLFKVISLGFTAKYYIADYDLVRGSAFSFDYGGLVHLGDVAVIGFNEHDANDPLLLWYGGTTEYINRGLNLGLCLTFLKPVTFSYDMEDVLNSGRIHHIGAGVSLFKGLVNVYGGMIIVDRNQTDVTGGLGLKYKGLGVGYSFNFNSDLSVSHNWSAAVYF